MLGILRKISATLLNSRSRNPAGRRDTLAFVRSESILDPAFYCRTYGLEESDTEALEKHYVDLGFPEGRLPRPDFDPLLCWLDLQGKQNIGTQAEYDLRTLWNHWRTSGQPSGFSACFPDVIASMRLYNWSKRGDEGAVRQQFEANAEDVNERSYRAARSFSKPHTVEFEIDRRPYTLKGLDSQFLIDRLRLDQPVTMARLPHGFWDWLLRRDQHRTLLERNEAFASLNETQKNHATVRVLFEKFGDKGVLVENQIPELLELLGSRPRDSRFLHLIAFRGFPLHDPNILFRSSMDNLTPPDLDRLRIFSSYFPPEEPLYDGFYWKRGVISGGFRDLPEACRDHPVILFGSDRLAQLGERWALPCFKHIQIPRRNSQTLRFEWIERLRGALQEAHEMSAEQDLKSPVLLTQCGGSFAYWILSKLFDDFPDVFLLDMGQALNAWCLETSQRMGWDKLYGRAIIENLGLEQTYRDALGSEYDTLIKEFFNPEDA